MDRFYLEAATVSCGPVNNEKPSGPGLPPRNGDSGKVGEPWQSLKHFNLVPHVKEFCHFLCQVIQDADPEHPVLGILWDILDCLVHLKVWIQFRVNYIGIFCKPTHYHTIRIVMTFFCGSNPLRINRADSTNPADFPLRQSVETSICWFSPHLSKFGLIHPTTLR